MESSRRNGDPEWLKSFHSDIEDGHQLNSYLEILQTTSSSKQTSVFMSRIRPKRDLEMFLSFHLDTKDGHALFQPSWASSNNIFQSLCPLDTQNSLNPSIEISKMTMH